MGQVLDTCACHNICEGTNGKEVNEFSLIEDESSQQEYPSPGRADENFR